MFVSIPGSAPVSDNFPFVFRFLFFRWSYSIWKLAYRWKCSTGCERSCRFTQIQRLCPLSRWDIRHLSLLGLRKKNGRITQGIPKKAYPAPHFQLNLVKFSCESWKLLNDSKALAYLHKNKILIYILFQFLLYFTVFMLFVSFLCHFFNLQTLSLSGYHKSREAVAKFYNQSNASLEADVSEPIFWFIYFINSDIIIIVCNVKMFPKICLILRMWSWPVDVAKLSNWPLVCYVIQEITSWFLAQDSLFTKPWLCQWASRSNCTTYWYVTVVKRHSSVEFNSQGLKSIVWFFGRNQESLWCLCCSYTRPWVTYGADNSWGISAVILYVHKKWYLLN